MTEVTIDEWGRPRPPFAGNEVDHNARLPGLPAAQWSGRPVGTPPPDRMCRRRSPRRCAQTLALVEDQWFTRWVRNAARSAVAQRRGRLPRWEWHSGPRTTGRTGSATNARSTTRTDPGPPTMEPRDRWPSLAGTAGRQGVAARAMMHLIEEYARHNGHPDGCASRCRPSPGGIGRQSRRHRARRGAPGRHLREWAVRAQVALLFTWNRRDAITDVTRPASRSAGRKLRPVLAMAGRHA